MPPKASDGCNTQGRTEQERRVNYCNAKKFVEELIQKEQFGGWVAKELLEWDSADSMIRKLESISTRT